MLKTITGYLQKALQTKHTGSAMSPLIWLNGTVGVLCLLLGAFISWPKGIVFIVIATILIFFTMAEYRRFARVNPRVLQSEAHQIDLAKLDLIASKGDGLVFDPVRIELGPEPRQLEHDFGAEGSE
ncbi:hypothetical protein [Dyella nitratireducens]|uniref:Uncharacterized protein n=1 Tax=Dyella nitratireducens TaxID=1849580 RepID=A0ABQ1GAD5_9GAMM|nr:hypothetical protein [Dyella nitratireducens]GGA39856.1 hypothetical protein GCM10010981_31390 [Dyella nitratireducens]GLQ40496.1 hypothetical protein GCM10007902_03450 [Dyella nitratireducens]